MVRMSAGLSDLATDWSQSIWWDDWLLVLAAVYRTRNSQPRCGVVAFKPGEKVQTLALPALTPTCVLGGRVSGAHAFRVKEYRPRTRSRDREIGDETLGVSFSPRHSGPECWVLTDPLRLRAEPFDTDRYILQVQHATGDAGDLTVEASGPGGTSRNSLGGRWCTNRHRRTL